ncbi:MAG: hypothetical protein WCE68_13050 [Anaerolineales bacterium]
MENKTRVTILFLLITSFLLLGCGSFPILVETDTPLPSPSITLTPTIPLTPIPTATQTIDLDCAPLNGKYLTLSQAIIGSWENGEETVWTFCRSGKLIETIADENPETIVQKYSLTGDVLIINDQSFSIVSMVGDELSITIKSLGAEFVLVLERIK